MTSDDGSSNWTNLRKIFETQGVAAAFKHLTTASDGGNTQSQQGENPLTQLKEAAVRNWASQIAPLQTDFSCGFFASPPKRDSRQEDRKQGIGSEINLDGVIDPTRRSLEYNSDAVQIEEESADLKTKMITPCSIDDLHHDQISPTARELFDRGTCPNSAAALTLDDVLAAQSTPRRDRPQSFDEATPPPQTQEAAEQNDAKESDVYPSEAIGLEANSDALDQVSSSEAIGLEANSNALDQSCLCTDGQTQMLENERQSLEEQTVADIEASSLVQRGRKPTAVSDWSSGDAMKSCDPALFQLHTDLLPAVGTMQVVGCVEASEEIHLDKPVWLVSADGDVSVVDAGSCEPWIWNFATDGLELAVQCRSGRGESGINQDNFSIAHAPGDRSIFTVCDGHGPYGCLIAFRIAQCLPKLIFEGISQGNDSIEQSIATAFRLANLNLQTFAAKHGLDFSCSGATCSLAVRQGSKVHVAWLGDSRALVGSVAADGCSQVNLYSPAHDVAEEAEQERLVAKGSELHMSSHGDGLRIAAPNQHGEPGLTVSRAFGDFVMIPHGLLAHPDLVKTSFAEVPGLILLASGGACEFQDDGEVVLERLIDEGSLLEKGVQHALSRFCDVAQNAWLGSHSNEFCDDVTALLLYWRRPVQEQCPKSTISAQGPLAPPAPRERTCLHNTASIPHEKSSVVHASSMPIVVDRSALSQQHPASQPRYEGVIPVITTRGKQPSYEPTLTLQQGNSRSIDAGFVEGPMVVRRESSLHAHSNLDACLNTLQVGGHPTACLVPEGPVFTANARSYRS